MMNPDGSKNESSTFIGNINPFRYRGYYYDVETGLYYLKTRYYDPEVGRFITIDDISYLAPDTINGLNLYAYCGNNPVMNVDPNGTDWWNPFSWDWGAIGRFVGGVTLVLVGLMVMGASLRPALSVIPGMGFVTQAGFSIMMYGGFMVGSVFDSDIKSDMDSIHWNPFNSDESLVTGSEKVSFYKGMPSVWINKESGRPGGFLGIWLKGAVDANTIRHEWGHGIQQGLFGWARFLFLVGLPSWRKWGGNHWRGDKNYYRRPWEVMADWFGGVTSDRAYYKLATAKDRRIAIWYTIVSWLLGPAAFLFLI